MSRLSDSTGRFCFKLDILSISCSAKKCMFHPMYGFEMQTHNTTKDSILEEYFFSICSQRGSVDLTTYNRHVKLAAYMLHVGH